MRIAWRTSRIASIAVLVFVLPLLMWVVGCGVKANMGPQPASMPTITVAASPSSISAGGSAILSVAATNATSVTVTGTDGSSYTFPSSGGTQTVKPTINTTYTATATGTGGTVTATTAVAVTAGATPAPTVTLAANPTSISAGSSSVLTVAATNSTSVTVTGTDGSSYTLQPAGGTQTVTPAATTTYTATATGSGGSATATASVTVVPASAPAATVTISANPASIASGGSSVLTVSASNATSVTVKGTDGSSYTLQPTGGTQTVTPSATTTYTATATGPGGSGTATATVTVTSAAPTVTILANPTTIVAGSSSTLTVTATNATSVTVTGSDQSNYTLQPTGGTQAVSPSATTTYTATATGNGGSATATATVTVTPAGSVKEIQHVIFMLQENHSFDNYFGMLNVYRKSQSPAWNIGADSITYDVDGIDDKLNTISNVNDEGTSFQLFKLGSTCVADETSSWLESYGQVSRYNFSPQRPIAMDGFVHTAENYAKDCAANGGTGCAGSFTASDETGQRAMGYYDDQFLNYYYYMASQFALSDRWFSPLSSKSTPNRIATFTGGTTQGLAFDPGVDDNLMTQLDIETIFRKLTSANVTWKLYYSVTQGGCLDEEDCQGKGASSLYPATDFSYFSDSAAYLYERPSSGCGSLSDSTVYGDQSDSFCVDTNHIAPIAQYYSDLKNNNLPQFAFIEAGYGQNDEHPGSGQSILDGQAEVASVVNALMTTNNGSNWYQCANGSCEGSVFFLAYDEGGGPYDHVPPVPGSSNQNTDAMVGDEPVGNIPDISSIAVNPETNANGTPTYPPCVPPGGVGTPATLHCDLVSAADPGANPGDAPAVEGFKAQLGFRVPNMVISPFTRSHYVSHIPMDHTAILKFVEDRFIGDHIYLTQRDAAQPNLLDFFDFTNVPWATPPTPPTPYSDGGASCTPTNIVSSQ